MTDELAQRTSESSGPAADGGATVAPEAMRTSASASDLTDPSLYFNRELSWLDFNDRVLQLAEDPRIPLLERVNFASIYEDNLDEFFMVRVAGLQNQVESKIDKRGADAMAAADIIDLIRQRTIELRSRLCRCFADEIRPALAEHGIRVLSLDAANAGEREEVEHLFTSQVFPALTPLVIGRGRPFPYISNMSLNWGVLLRNPEKNEEVAARVKVPKELLRRFLSIGDGLTFVPLEDVVAANLDDLFPGMEIVHQSLFRVTRDTDYDVSDEADDLLLAVEEEVRRRRFGEVVRLEVTPDMDPGLRDQLVAVSSSARLRERRPLPLLQPTDTFGQVLVEAGASGLPSVRSTRAGPRRSWSTARPGGSASPTPACWPPRSCSSPTPRPGARSSAARRSRPPARAPGRRRWASSPTATTASPSRPSSLASSSSERLRPPLRSLR